MTEEILGGLVLGVCALVAGALVHAVTRSAAAGRLPRNGAAGIRTRRTKASDEAWLTGHTAALPWTRRTAWATAALGLLTLAAVVAGSVELALAVGLTANAVLLAGCLLGTRAAHRAIAEA